MAFALFALTSTMFAGGALAEQGEEGERVLAEAHQRLVSQVWSAQSKAGLLTHAYMRTYA